MGIGGDSTNKRCIHFFILAENRGQGEKVPLMNNLRAQNTHGKQVRSGCKEGRKNLSSRGRQRVEGTTKKRMWSREG